MVILSGGFRDYATFYREIKYDFASGVFPTLKFYPFPSLARTSLNMTVDPVLMEEYEVNTASKATVSSEK